MPHSYEDYENKSSTYTNFRVPLGFEEGCRWFSKNPNTPVAEQTLLDAGCGTGNHLMRYLEQFTNIQAMDFSEGMLTQCRNQYQQKLEEIDDPERKAQLKVDIQQGDICDLQKFESNSFDALCNNQVIHHLRPDNDFADLRKAVKEFARVLKPGGRIAINWSPAEQEKIGIWWAELIPKAVDTWAPRTPSCEKLSEIFADAGLSKISVAPVTEGILYSPDLYFHPETFFEAGGARSDSTFNLCSAEELESAAAKVKQMKEDGTLGDWFAKKEADRKATGQTTMILAEKPA